MSRQRLKYIYREIIITIITAMRRKYTIHGEGTDGVNKSYYTILYS